MPRFHPNFQPAGASSEVQSPMDKYAQFQNIQNQQDAVSQAGQAQQMEALKTLYGMQSDQAMQPAHLALLQAQAANMYDEAKNRDLIAPAQVRHLDAVADSYPGREETRQGMVDAKNLGVLNSAITSNAIPQEDRLLAMQAGSLPEYARQKQQQQKDQLANEWQGMVPTFTHTQVPSGDAEAAMRAKWGNPAVDYLRGIYDPVQAAALKEAAKPPLPKGGHPAGRMFD